MEADVEADVEDLGAAPPVPTSIGEENSGDEDGAPPIPPPSLEVAMPVGRSYALPPVVSLPPGRIYVLPAAVALPSLSVFAQAPAINRAPNLPAAIVVPVFRAPLHSSLPVTHSLPRSPPSFRPLGSPAGFIREQSPLVIPSSSPPPPPPPLQQSGDEDFL